MIYKNLELQPEFRFIDARIDTNKIDISKKDEKKLKQVCQDFESIFLYFLLKEMRKTIPKSGFLDGGLPEEFFQEMLDEEISKALARANGIGIAQMLYKQLSI